MKVTVIGAGGMIGKKLVERLLHDGHLNSSPLTELHLVDVANPLFDGQTELAVSHESADLSEPGVASRLIARQPDIIFHLAAVVSGEAERDFSKGYRVNLDGTRYLLEAIRLEHEHSGYCPRLIFASSIAVYGTPLPDIINDTYQQTPLSSYGVQKRIGELLLADYHRRGFVDGIGLRLPTICIRPGKPNQAASSFFSGILREPINGQPATLPVPDETRHWFASPRAAVSFLLQAAALGREKIGDHCTFNLPGLSATVAEQIDALERVVGSHAVALIQRQADPEIATMVANWPAAFDASRAIDLGFRAETNFDDIIKVYLEDDFMPA